MRQLAPFDHWGAGWVFAHLLYIYLCSDNLCNQLSMAALGLTVSPTLRARGFPCMIPLQSYCHLTREASAVFSFYRGENRFIEDK